MINALVNVKQHDLLICMVIYVKFMCILYMHKHIHLSFSNSVNCMLTQSVIRHCLCLIIVMKAVGPLMFDSDFYMIYKSYIFLCPLTRKRHRIFIMHQPRTWHGVPALAFVTEV